MRSVTVIGGGPGGSLAALLLARAGMRVCLVEQHRFPRDKVCGECVSALGWTVLERAGLAERVKRAGAMRMTRGIVHAAGGRAAEIKLPAAMWGISRSSFDLILLEAARAQGVEVLQPARVEENAQNEVRVRNLATNSLETIESDVVILANGKGNKDSTEDFGIKAHFEIADCARDRVQLFGCRGCYGGVAPIEGGLFNIACSVQKERIERCREVEAVFEELLSENVRLARIMRGSKRVTQWMAAPLPRFGVKSDWPMGVIPIGNAAAALEPIGGEGMGLALRSAELAAEAIFSNLDLNITQKKLQRQFGELWRWRRILWRAVAMMVARPLLCEMMVDVMNVTSSGEWVVQRAKNLAGQ